MWLAIAGDFKLHLGMHGTFQTRQADHLLISSQRIVAKVFQSQPRRQSFLHNEGLRVDDDCHTCQSHCVDFLLLLHSSYLRAAQCPRQL
jgi:hypothetical protein